jgi:hypothetical protein
MIRNLPVNQRQLNQDAVAKCTAVEGIQTYAAASSARRSGGGGCGGEEVGRGERFRSAPTDDRGGPHFLRVGSFRSKNSHLDL